MTTDLEVSLRLKVLLFIFLILMITVLILLVYKNSYLTIDDSSETVNFNSRLKLQDINQ